MASFHYISKNSDEKHICWPNKILVAQPVSMSKLRWNTSNLSQILYIQNNTRKRNGYSLPCIRNTSFSYFSSNFTNITFLIDIICHQNNAFGQNILFSLCCSDEFLTANFPNCENNCGLGRFVVTVKVYHNTFLFHAQQDEDSSAKFEFSFFFKKIGW